MIARFEPVHLGHAALLEALCARSDRLLIGVGSSNRRDARNPFTYEETRAQVDALLAGRFAGRYRVLPVPDLGHGPRWARMVRRLLGPLDLFCTANGWVRDLLATTYLVVHPLQVVSPARRVRVDGAMVRRAMARGDDWRRLVPPSTADTLDRRGLPERFRRERGPETLAREAADEPTDGGTHVLLGR